MDELHDIALDPLDIVRGVFPDAEVTETGEYVLVRTPEFVLDVRRMIFNWRLHAALPEMYGKTYERGYCYFGTGLGPLVRSLVAAEAWVDPFGTDPIGFDRKAF